MTPPENDSFSIHLLMVGAYQWLAHRQDNDFNLPDITRWALHSLHRYQLIREESPTLTHLDTLLYLVRPIAEIFDSSSIPSNLSATQILDNFPIETEFDLADDIWDYMDDMGLNSISNIRDLIELTTNAPARSKKVDLSNQYQTLGLTDQQRRNIESEYVRWRTFFSIENNIVNPATSGLLFDSLWAEIRDKFYEPAYLRHSQVVTYDKKGKPVYRISEQCGLLYRNSSGEFQPIVAYPNFDPYNNIRLLPVEENDFVLKRTHQRRILIPGIPELYLFGVLNSHPAVHEVRLYPGVDRYDLRVNLRNGIIHAIDIKDHRRTTALENLLRRKRVTPNISKNEQNELEYDSFFYLLPDARVEHYDRGLTNLKILAKRHMNVMIMSVSEYLESMNNV